MDDFDLELKTTFLDECGQLITDAEESFIALDSGDRSASRIDHIFRLAHSFKGGAKAVGFESLAKFAHKLEDVLQKVKSEQVVASRAVCTVLLQSLDVLKTYVDGLKTDLAFSYDSTEVEVLLQKTLDGTLETVSEIEKVEAAIEPAQVQPAEVPRTLSQEDQSAKNNTPPATKVVEDEFLRVSTKKLDDLLNIVGELVVNQSMVSQHRSQGTISSQHAIQTISYIDKLVNEIQFISMALRMLPIKPLFQKMRRVVRDASTSLGKDIELVTEGEDVELDKSIIDKITDPLTHMIRNAVDHGIETMDERKQNGKSAQARVFLSAVQKEDRMQIIIKDDGRGMDKDKIYKKAVEKNIIKNGDVLSNEEIYGLIFAPGFSTKEQVSDFSGRGVGMDVVKRSVEDLKGSVQIETVLGQGSTFTILLPLSLSIISGLVVDVDHRKYVVPIAQLMETIEYDKFKIETITNKGRMLNIRGEIMPVLSLKKILHGTKSQKGEKLGIGIVTSYLGRKVSFEIDEICGQQQIVLKKLGKEVRGIPGVVAGAILNDGEPGLVINLFEFIEREVNNAA